MVYILIAILIFGVLIAVHEFGHFLAAKACGVRVNEFSIGMGPQLFHKTKGDTEYSLRLLPIGGYCAMEGEDEDSDDDRALGRQVWWKKFIIFVAGAFMNFLTGLIIVICLYAGAQAFYTTEIVELNPDFPQQGEDGLMPGDMIYAINGERIYLKSDVSLIMGLGDTGTIDMTVLRDGKKLDRTLTRQVYTDENGQEYEAYGFTYGGIVEATPLLRLQYSWYQTMDYVRIVRLSLQMLLSGAAGVNDLSGPVGIVSTITEVGKETEAEAGFGAALESILYFAAMFAVNLAVMNLLPLPALDGGHVLFLLVNGIAVALFKKEIPSKYLNVINGIGFALLMALMRSSRSTTLSSSCEEDDFMSKQIIAGGVAIGGGAPVTIQSMCNTHTEDAKATIAQIHALEEAGCEIVRVTVPNMEAAHALSEIKENISIPLVADIHFDYRLAVEAAARGADKIRINPGNIGGDDRVKAVVDACREHKVPIRIGVNGGSLEKELLAKYGHVTPEALVESALRHVRLLEKFDFTEICISVKSSDVPLNMAAYRLLHEKVDYPLHLGVTEAGTPTMGLLKSAIGIGGLLCEGIGDTMRVSLTADHVEEVYAAKRILQACGIRRSGVNLVSCPTCGRTAYDMIPIAEELERRLADCKKNITVAVMGCVVNGPGEASAADIGVAGGEGEGMIFRKGKILYKVPQEKLVDALMEEIKKL